MAEVQLTVSARAEDGGYTADTGALEHAYPI